VKIFMKDWDMSDAIEIGELKREVQKLQAQLADATYILKSLIKNNKERHQEDRIHHLRTLAKNVLFRIDLIPVAVVEVDVDPPEKGIFGQWYGVEKVKTIHEYDYEGTLIVWPKE